MSIITKHDKYWGEVETMTLSGMTCEEISEKIGVCAQTIGRWKKRHGVRFPPRKRYRLEPHIETIETMRKNGATYDDIAAVIGFSQGAVNRYFNDYAIRGKGDGEMRLSRENEEWMKAITRHTKGEVFVIRELPDNLRREGGSLKRLHAVGALEQCGIVGTGRDKRMSWRVVL